MGCPYCGTPYLSKIEEEECTRHIMASVDGQVFVLSCNISRMPNNNNFEFYCFCRSTVCFAAYLVAEFRCCYPAISSILVLLGELG